MPRGSLRYPSLFGYLIFATFQKLSGSQGIDTFEQSRGSGRNPFSKNKRLKQSHWSADLRSRHRGPMSVHIPYANECRIINFPQRQRVAINGFCRVTKYRRCRVCRKPDWCGYTTDELTSICMRISTGSKGTSRNGGNIFHHNRLFLVASPRTARKEAPPPIEIAPIEVRNAVYQE
jgi:hypothetical protein